MYLSQKLWILRKLTHLSDLTEITDSNGFSKETLLPFGDITYKILYIHKMNRFYAISLKQCFNEDLQMNKISNVLVYQLFLVT